jgi:hypothetical protein
MQLVSRQTLGPPSVPPKDDVAEFEVGPTEAAIEQESEPCRLHEDGAQVSIADFQGHELFL